MLSFLVIVALSVVVAALLGHLVHWLLHQRWTGPFYRGHMEHHLDHYPPKRLTSHEYLVPKWHRSGPVLFTPAFLVISAAVGGLTWALNVSHWLSVAFMLGILAFGLLTDAIHDAFHLESSWRHRFPGFARMRARHFGHHRNMRKNYGIIIFAWDRALGTLKDE